MTHGSLAVTSWPNSAAAYHVVICGMARYFQQTIWSSLNHTIVLIAKPNITMDTTLPSWPCLQFTSKTIKMYKNVWQIQFNSYDTYDWTEDTCINMYITNPMRLFCTPSNYCVTYSNSDNSYFHHNVTQTVDSSCTENDSTCQLLWSRNVFGKCWYGTASICERLRFEAFMIFASSSGSIHTGHIRAHVHKPCYGTHMTY